MLLIAAAKFQSMKEACNWPVLMEEKCVQSQSKTVINYIFNCTIAMIMYDQLCCYKAELQLWKTEFKSQAKSFLISIVPTRLAIQRQWRGRGNKVVCR